jgi:GLPGLI family protein
MKKIMFYVLIQLFVLQKTEAQVELPCMPRDISNMTTIDSGNIRILYALNATDIGNPETYDDLQRLEIGRAISKYYSYFTYKADSFCTYWLKDWKTKHPNVQSIPNCGKSFKSKNTKWMEYYSSEYFKDFSRDILADYVTLPIMLNPSKYQYTENIPVQDWTLEDDTLTVVGYSCQKAVCQFRGRDYTAWFASDIPINNGPWKFGGLPGLILKIYDDDKLYVFECVGIENNTKKYPIGIYSYENYIKTDRKKLWKLQKNLHEDITKVLPGLKLYSGHDINNLGPEIPWSKVIYRPLELE